MNGHALDANKKDPVGIQLRDICSVSGKNNCTPNDVILNPCCHLFVSMTTCDQLCFTDCCRSITCPVKKIVQADYQNYVKLSADCKSFVLPYSVIYPSAGVSSSTSIVCSLRCLLFN